MVRVNSLINSIEEWGITEVKPDLLLALLHYEVWWLACCDKPVERVSHPVTAPSLPEYKLIAARRRKLRSAGRQRHG